MILMSRSGVMVTSLGSCMMYTTLYERYEDRTSVPNIKCGFLESSTGRTEKDGFGTRFGPCFGS
jgi:hypothetical protein